MPAFPEQFRDARSRVEPKGDDVENAIAAHEDVRTVLEGCDDLVAMGIDTVLIGSYKRHVSIHRIKDVDVFSKLPDAGSVAPSDLLDLVEQTLVDVYGQERIERQSRSLKADFPDYDLAVDAVPARPCGGHWEIPDAEGGWEETDPLKLTDLSSDMNAEYREEYVPTVKLVRQVRRAQLGDAPPGGLYLEIATYHAFDSGIDANSAGGYLAAALQGVATQLDQAASSGLPDPTLPDKTISTRATDAELAAAAERFADCSVQAQEALDSDDPCPAAKVFRDLLGRDSDDRWVFPMPSYCNDDGTRRSTGVTATAGSRHVTEDSRFA